MYLFQDRRSLLEAGVEAGMEALSDIGSLEDVVPVGDSYS